MEIGTGLCLGTWKVKLATKSDRLSGDKPVTVTGDTGKARICTPTFLAKAKIPVPPYNY